MSLRIPSPYKLNDSNFNVKFSEYRASLQRTHNLAKNDPKKALLVNHYLVKNADIHERWVLALNDWVTANTPYQFEVDIFQVAISSNSGKVIHFLAFNTTKAEFDELFEHLQRTYA